MDKRTTQATSDPIPAAATSPGMPAPGAPPPSTDLLGIERLVEGARALAARLTLSR